MLTVGDLFSGIGGFSLGLERAGMRTRWFSEIDPYASAVLRKHWPHIPNHGDIRGIRAGTAEPVDLICGGFPCQPFSHAGQRRGKDDDRHLWPEMLRVVDELRPAWVLGENVAGIISMELDQVLSDLEALGYAARAFVVPAVAVDAPHRRDRVWIVARDTRRADADSDDGHSNENDAIRTGRDASSDVCDCDRDREPALAVDAEMAWLRGVVADTEIGKGWWIQQPRLAPNSGTSRGLSGADEQGSQGRDERRERTGERFAGPCCWPDEGEWFAQSGMGRLAHGIPQRVARLRCFGNAVVPQVVEVIGRAILKAHQ